MGEGTTSWIVAICEVVTTAMVILGAAAAIYTKLSKLVVRFDRLEYKVGVLWDFLRRRAEVEALDLHIATKNSPLLFNKEILEAYAPIRDELQAFYLTRGKDLSLNDLMIETENLFGEFIAYNVCTKFHIRGGSCLLAAIELMKGPAVQDSSCQ